MGTGSVTPLDSDKTLAHEKARLWLSSEKDRGNSFGPVPPAGVLLSDFWGAGCVIKASFSTVCVVDGGRVDRVETEETTAGDHCLHRFIYFYGPHTAEQLKLLHFQTRTKI